MANKTSTMNMTEGPILKEMILFSLPLLLGNIFQLLYNTVDTLVVGNFVGTQALAAVGSTTMVVNLVVFFFNGLSIGAGVIIGQSYGAKDYKRLHIAIETTILLTILVSIVFTIGGILLVKTILIFMATPNDVLPSAMLYLRIYFLGIIGLTIYNMGSGILRAVGDTTRPLYFLILTSLLNIVLDLVFVLVFKAGIAGVAYATIISQAISAILVVVLLSKTDDIYKLTYNDLRIDSGSLKDILAVGLPAAFQSILTSFSNIFVQSYINYFGAAVMAGWSCYNKLDQFVFLPILSMMNASTTFVSQNIGANQYKRVRKGTRTALVLTEIVVAMTIVALLTFSKEAVSIFTKDQSVIKYGVLFIRVNMFFFIFGTFNNVIAGALRGRGDSKGPMIIMLLSFVLIRQIYLFIMTKFISNTPAMVGFGYPVGWMSCSVIMLVYYLWKVRNDQTNQEG